MVFFWSWHFINSFNPTNNPKIGILNVSSLQVRKWRQRKTRQLTQSHMTTKWQSENLNSGSLAPEPLLFSSVQFSRSVTSYSLQPHESQHTRPPCPSPTPGVHSDSRPPSQWCHPAISSSAVPFSSCPQFLPASGSFPMSQLFTWGGQSIGVSASASILSLNTQDWSPLG